MGPPNIPSMNELWVAVLIYAPLITLARWVISTLVTPFAVRGMRLAPVQLSAPPALCRDFDTFYDTKRAKPKNSKEKVTAKALLANEWKEFAKGLEPKHNLDSNQISLLFQDYKAYRMRETKLKKFAEATWRCVFYGFIVLFGVYVLYDKPWLADVSKVWEGYPHQVYTADIRMYYYLSLGHYIHLVVSQFFDVKRKDFWEMFLHHLATLGLLTYSWGLGCIRVGTLVLLVHDVADVFMEGAKICKYLKFHTVCDLLFVAFAVVFLVCRLYVFPVYIMAHTVYAPVSLMNLYIFNAMLVTLLCLHVFWASIILTMAWRFLRFGQVEQDARSDTESEDEATPHAQKKQA